MKLLLCCLLLMTPFAEASDQLIAIKILKIFSNKKEFVVQKTDDLEEGMELKIKSSKEQGPSQGTATVKTCKARSCLAELSVGIFELDPQSLSSYQCTISEGQYKNSAYFGYGSPLGSALRLGLRRKYNKDFSYGAVVESIDSKSGAANVKANGGSLIGSYAFINYGNWDLNLNGELGLIFSTIDFVKGEERMSVKENVFLAALSLEFLYSFDRLKLGLNLGVSKNGLKSKYASTNGEFSNPFGTILVFTEFGVHYEF